MNYDDFLVRGIRGEGYWAKIKDTCFSHNDMLLEMRKCQENAKTYGQLGLHDESKTWAMNAIFMETMAWRVFWFGERSRIARKPGIAGEYNKALRNNYIYYDDKGGKSGDYWSSRDALMVKFGEWGCNQEHRIFSETYKRPCLNIYCKHRGIKEATKALKKYAHRDWERDYRNKYRY